MSEVVVHVLKPIAPAPGPPSRWSFSDLRKFQTCPRRWYLDHSRYDKFAGRLPAKLSRAAVEGDLLHTLLERYYDRSRSFEQLFKPRQVLLALVEVWYEKNKTNQRGDTRRLYHQLSLPDILHHFRKAVESCGEAVAGVGARSNGERVGTEVWLNDKESKLYGRCDLIKDNRLIDFKTGEPHDWHKDQVLFYASLRYAETGHLLGSAELLYLETFESVVVAVPSSAEMEMTLTAYRALSSQADHLISLGKCKAYPKEAECQMCAVRMFCSVYCQGEASRRVFAQQPDEGLVDFVCENAEVLKESAGAVLKVVSDLGTRSLFLPMPIVSEVGAENLSKLRVINVAVRSNENGVVEAKLTSASEAFIVDGVE